MRDSVPSARYSSVCNVLRQWRIWLIEFTDSMIESTDSMVIEFKQKCSDVAFKLRTVNCAEKNSKEVAAHARAIYVRKWRPAPYKSRPRLEAGRSSPEGNRRLGLYSRKYGTFMYT